MKRLSRILLLTLILKVTVAQFDYQVGARAQDCILSFLTYVRKAGAVPYIVANMEDVNITNAYTAGPRIIFPSAKANNEFLPTWFYGLETGYALIYYTGVPSVAFTISNGTGKVPIWVEHKYHPLSGVILNPTGSRKAYDVKNRPWYVECKAANTTIWAKPFFTFGPQQPALALAQPFYNLKINGRRFPGFAGVLAFETSLNGINDYLRNVFSQSKYDIFILEKSTLNIIGSSWGADSFRILSPTSRQYIKATDSQDPIIRSATNKLIEKGFTKDLFILGDKYVQCDTYKDSIPGIEWYVVVLMPASLETDHLGPSSRLFNGVLIVSSFTVAITFIALCCTFYFMKTRLLRLTRPVFTITILIGSFLVLAYCYLLLNKNTESLCAARPWVFNLSFTFAFSPLLIKAWRVHIMFNVNPMSKNKLVSNILLLSYTLVLVVVDAVILAVTLYGVGDGTKPRTDLVLSSYGAYAEMTFCSYTFNNAFFYTEVFYKGLLIFTACTVSFLIRKIAGTIAGSKSLLIIVYNIGFTSLVILAIGQSISSVETRIFLQVVGICFCVIVTAFVLVWPTFHELIMVGDQAAADDVLNEVFVKSKGDQTASKNYSEPHASQNYSRNKSVGSTSQTLAGGGLSLRSSVFNILGEKRASQIGFLEKKPSMRDKPAALPLATKVQVVHVSPKIDVKNEFSQLEAQAEGDEKNAM